MRIRDEAIAVALDAYVPRRSELGDWQRVLSDALEAGSAPRRTRARLYVAALVAAVVLAVPVLAVGATQGWFSRDGGTVPSQILFPVHGRVIGWTRIGPHWFVVYLGGKAGGTCGLQGATWRLALVSGKPLPFHVVDDRRLSGAGCGNELAWVKSGRFSDGAHDEVAFMLWTSPSLGATTYIYRLTGNRLHLLAHFPGDKVVLGHGTVTVSYENAGRSPHGELEDVYRFRDGRYVPSH